MYHNFVKESDTVGSFTYRTYNNRPYYTTQYADDYNHIQEMLKRQEEEWNRKRREEEEMYLKEKPKTYGYTAPYQSLLPPPDINKFFHDSKYLRERPPVSPEDYSRDAAPFKANPGTGISTYELAYMSPRQEAHKTPPGGLYIIRFNDVGFDDVRLALREQQSVIRSSNGYILGIARSHNVVVFEGDSDWTFARNQKPRPQIAVPHRCVDDAIAMMWFPSYEKASEYCNTGIKNRFRQMDFPTPHSSEAHYVPMVTPPFIGELDTFLFFELLNVGNRAHLKENLQHFEEEAREKMLEFNKNCIPFVVSAVLPTGVQMRRGSRGQMFRVGSKLFVSRFSSLADVSALWQAGIIQQARQNWGLNGPVNAYAIALKDFHD